MEQAEEGMSGNALVNHHDHSLLAMAGLSTEDPDGLGIVDRDGEDWVCTIGLGNGHEAGFDHSGGSGGVGLGEGNTGGVEGRLSHCVVLGK